VFFCGSSSKGTDNVDQARGSTTPHNKFSLNELIIINELNEEHHCNTSVNIYFTLQYQRTSGMLTNINSAKINTSFTPSE
jgi:hypothetical protein